MKQSEEMLNWAGDNWLRRNKQNLGKTDRVGDLIESKQLVKPTDKVLEIGCSNGWRLKKLHEKYGCEVFGLEPGLAACAEAEIRNRVRVKRGVAASVPWDDESFDIVIIGFFLFVTEPSEWLRTVAESDRVLKDDGKLIIHEFCCPRPIRLPYAADVELAVHGKLWNYYFDWPSLWLAHPGYSMLEETYALEDAVAVTVLHKQMTKAASTL
jgi:SAM-dependent methyltransferase